MTIPRRQWLCSETGLGQNGWKFCNWVDVKVKKREKAGIDWNETEWSRMEWDRMECQGGDNARNWYH